MIRTAVLALLGMVACTSIATAAPPAFYVVEIANFACAHCRAMEAEDPQLERDITAAGGQFDFAPVVWGDTAPARDFVYYAARIQGPAAAALVRESLFRGVQDDSLSFSSAGQAVDWLQTDLPADAEINFGQLQSNADDQTLGQMPEAKAEHLAQLAGVAATPTYIFLKAGQIVGTVAYGEGSTPDQLASQVEAEIKKLAGARAPSL